VRIYLSDINLWEQVNEVYAYFLGDHKPVRCVIPTGSLHHGCLIEAEVIAAKNDCEI
jgi:enamine deaminase RidA (YjgF/YER057c/UK114 family)